MDAFTAEDMIKVRARGSGEERVPYAIFYEITNIIPPVIYIGAT